MGQHRQALDIYVFKMKDPGKAEEYVTGILAPISDPDHVLATATRYNSPKSRRQRRRKKDRVQQRPILRTRRHPSTIRCYRCTYLLHPRTSHNGARRSASSPSTERVCQHHQHWISSRKCFRSKSSSPTSVAGSGQPTPLSTKAD